MADYLDKTKSELTEDELLATEIRMKISSRINSLMNDSGMRLSELAKRSGMTITGVRRVITAEYSPSLLTIAKLEKSLGNKIIEVAEDD